MIKYTILFIILFSNLAFSQLYQGPASGSVSSGVIVNTNNFDNTDDFEQPFVRQPVREHMPIQIYPEYMNNFPISRPEGSNYISDPSLTGSDSPLSSDPLVLKNFLGFPDPGNYIPPDQYIAAGPQHIMAVDNGRFRIWDKSGNLIKSIGANQWFATALSGADAFDPKVSYDHYNKRWVMVWLEQRDPPNQRGYFLISVSDDSIPIGTWYNWAISNTLNGSTESGTWSDYQGVGFDNQVLYITGRQFQFGGGFTGCKFRIVGKANLYANTAGQLTWTDLWDVRDPDNLNIRPDAIRPSVIYGSSSEYYFMCSSPFGSGNFLILYKLVNPLSSPSMTGVRVPVTAFNTPPLANQLGGSTILIESGGAVIRFEPVFRNGFIWTTHSVGNGNYSSVNYVKINTSTNTAVEDVTFGAAGFWHFYPALSIDQNMNLLLSYSRSGETEYIGAYYTSRLNTDPPGVLSGSKPLQVGKANYVKDFGSGRNRWGDYNGSWLDPADPNNFWIITEYAEFPANTWACQIGNLRLIPFSGPRIFTSSDSLYFGVREINTNSDTLRVAIYNYGSDTLVISNALVSNTQFQITSTLSFPVRVAFRDSITVKLLFRPASAGQVKDTLKIFSNDNTNATKKVILFGRGFVINPAAAGIIYGVTGSQENGVFITIDKNTGTGTTVGSTGFTQLTGISVRPSNKEVYATNPGGSNTQLVRINVSLGDAYVQANVPVANMRAIAFDLNDVLYSASIDGRLFKINPSNGDTDLIGNTGISNLYGLSINPLNGQLWGISVTTGVYKINKQNGTSALVGATGFSVTPDLCFDAQGRLYALNGIGTQICNLLTIDTSTGAGTLIGSIGKRGVNGLAISPHPIGIEPLGKNIPNKFELYQNYPNPFNPFTKIKFDLPRHSLVKITLYNVIGEEVVTLVNQKLDAGSFDVPWNAVNYASGIYFYRIEAGDFVQTKKMVLVK